MNDFDLTASDPPGQGPAAPACCGATAAFVESLGSGQIRDRGRDFEHRVLDHLKAETGLSLENATSLLATFGAAISVYRCEQCRRMQIRLDQM